MLFEFNICPGTVSEVLQPVRPSCSLTLRHEGPSYLLLLPHPGRLMECSGRFDRFNPLMRGTQQLGNLGIPTAQARVHLCNCFSRLLGQYSAEGSVLFVNIEELNLVLSQPHLKQHSFSILLRGRVLLLRATPQSAASAGTRTHVASDKSFEKHPTWQRRDSNPGPPAWKS